jgi:hypothetical protein
MFFLVAAAFSAGLCGCAAPVSESSAVRGVGAAVGLTTQQGPVSDFVRASRTGEGDFIPVGREGQPRDVALRNAEGVKRLEAELEAARARSEAFARRGLPAGPKPVRHRPRPDGGIDVVPDTNAPSSFPVSPQRAQQMREDARRARP